MFWKILLVVSFLCVLASVACTASAYWSTDTAEENANYTLVILVSFALNCGMYYFDTKYGDQS